MSWVARNAIGFSLRFLGVIFKTKHLFYEKGNYLQENPVFQLGILIFCSKLDFSLKGKDILGREEK